MAQKQDRASYDLTRVHEVNLKLLKEIDRICRKYKINYMLDSGTLLGAVRHGGFIPWDDDVDVAFTRPNFELFLKVARRELPEGMSLLCPEELQNGRVFYDFTPRIIYEKSKVHEDNRQMQFYEGRLNHLWVDLFVLDKLPEQKYSAAFSKLLQKILYGMAIAHRDKIDFSKYGLIDKIRVGLLSAAGHLFPMKLLYHLQKWAAMKDQKKKTRKWYYSNYQPDYLYVTLDADWCAGTIDLEFEGERLMAPRGYDQVLKQIYGDYQSLPPEEKRVPAHSSIEIQIFD